MAAYTNAVERRNQDFGDASRDLMFASTNQDPWTPHLRDKREILPGVSSIYDAE